MSDLWEGYLSGSVVPDTEECFSTWGTAPEVNLSFSSSFMDEEEALSVVDEIEVACDSPEALQQPKSRLSLFRCPMPLNRSECEVYPTVVNSLSNFDCAAFLCEEKWDHVVRYSGPEALASELSSLIENSSALFEFMQILIPDPDFWHSIVESLSDGKRRT